jgi:hypothetical protein
MALGDYTKTPYVDGNAPSISAANLNNNENKVKELDTNLVTSTLITSIGNTGIMLGKNKLINGNFDFWQRGTTASLSTVAAYVADRWYSACGAVGTVNRRALTPGQVLVPGNPDYYMEFAVSSGDATTGYATMIQHIENVQTLAGKQVTLSFYAKASSALNVAVTHKQGFGTGGSIATPDALIQKIALSTTWQKYSITYTVPSITGKTLGSDSKTHSYYSIYFWIAAGTDFSSFTGTLGMQTGTFDFAQIQLEEGPTATNFEQRPYGLELMLCQRYYEKSYAKDTLPNAVTTVGIVAPFVGTAGTGAMSAQVFFKAAKRTETPTIYIYDGSGNGGIGAAGRCDRSGINKVCAAQYTSNVGFNAVSTDATSSLYLLFHYTADAEL